MCFKYPLRKYQEEILDVVQEKLKNGEREIHIVAPPGAGKTIIGLQLISMFKCPSLIMSPNTTIQAQWGQKLDLFFPDGVDLSQSVLGTHEDKPLKPITVMTYQVLSTPGREQEYLNKLAHKGWIDELCKGRGLTIGEAELRVLEILQNNPKAHQKEMSRHASRLRKRLADVMDLSEVLHPNAIELLQSLRRQKFRLVLFDECHHLTDYWAAIMLHLIRYLDDPLIIGLTGTPPEKKSASQEGRYLSIVGDIDYQVPTPALVREGGLAPFQDLAYFVEPTEKEFFFLEEQHKEFNKLIAYLCGTDWLSGKGNLRAEQLDPATLKALGARLEGGKALPSTISLPSALPEAHPVARPEARPETRPVAHPEARPVAFSDVQTDELSDALADSAPEAPADKIPVNFAPPSEHAHFDFDEIDEGVVEGGYGNDYDFRTETQTQAADADGQEHSNNQDHWHTQEQADTQERSEALKNSDSSNVSLAAPHPTNAQNAQNAPISSNATHHDFDAPPLAEGALPPLTKWVLEETIRIESEKGFERLLREDSAKAQAFLRALNKLKLPRPRRVEFSEGLMQAPLLEDWMLLIEDFASHRLKLSASAQDHALFHTIRNAIRKLGYSITEQGLRRQASPVDRVLAFSESKSRAVTEILALEYRVLQDQLRACVVTDFERMSATSVKSLEGILNEESGGALAVMRTLLKSPISLYLNPCLVTGSLLLIDKRVADQFAEAASEYLKQNGYDFQLQVNEQDGTYCEITAGSTAWESRLYVALATHIFERGITKCLIGTRGLFGEGWDSQALNTLIDLTTTTAPVSVKQLRGRSIRIQNDALGARKVANNWDVVCIAPSLEKGLNDYQRFVRKHDGFFGICDDGQIECGVGHVHPSFSELTPREVFASVDVFNQEMMERALVRHRIYDLWKVGEPYNNRLLECLEVARLRKIALTPPHLKRNLKYKEHAKEMRSALNGVLFEYMGLGAVGAIVTLFFTLASGPLALSAALPLFLSATLARFRYKNLSERMRQDLCKVDDDKTLAHQGLIDMSVAVLSALQIVKQVPTDIAKESLQATIRSDGSYRVFLDDVSPKISKVFNQALSEVLAPISNQPYLIPKYEFPLAQVATEEERQKFYKKYLAGRAEPKVGSYHAVPSLLARSEKGRAAFQEAWNKYVSPGFIIETETKPELLNKYFGIGPSLAQRLLWE